MGVCKLNKFLFLPFFFTCGALVAMQKEGSEKKLYTLKEFRLLPISERVKDETIMAYAKDFLAPDEDREFQPEVILVSQILANRLRGDDEIKKKSAQDFLSGLNSSQQQLLLKGAVGDYERSEMVFCRWPQKDKESIGNNLATAAMGASLAYAFFRWHNWSDIKRWDVWAPLSLSILLSKFSGPAGRSAALSYGPMAGTIARFIEQSRAQGGMRNFAKRSYQATTISPVSGFFAGLGAVAGFFTGVLDLNLLSVLRPVATLFFGTKNVDAKMVKANDTDSFKNPKTVGAVSCYLIRTLDPILYPVHAPLVTGAESLGKSVRAVAVQMGVV